MAQALPWLPNLRDLAICRSTEDRFPGRPIITSLYLLPRLMKPSLPTVYRVAASFLKPIESFKPVKSLKELIMNDLRAPFEQVRTLGLNITELQIDGYYDHFRHEGLLLPHLQVYVGSLNCFTK